MRYGIAFTHDGSPVGRIVGWMNDEDHDLTWDTREEALAHNDLSGWTGYVREYEELSIHEAMKTALPIAENSIPRLVPMITVKESVSVDDAPDRIIFVVNGEDLLRYVNLAAIPSELVRVVNLLPCRPGSIFSKVHLVEAVEDLLVSAKKIKTESQS